MINRDLRSFEQGSSKELPDLSAGVLKEEELPREKLISIKPANSDLSDEEWVAVAESYGLTDAWAELFREYKRTYGPKIKGILEGGKGHSVLFGHAGEEGFAITPPGDLKEFVHFMIETDWTLDQMGVFGQWMKEAKIPPRYAKAIIKAFFED